MDTPFFDCIGKGEGMELRTEKEPREQYKVFRQVEDALFGPCGVAAGDHVIAGFSGGADSLFLTVMLARLQAAGKITASAVHIHHGIRGNTADADAEAAEAWGERLGIRCHVVYASVPALSREKKMSLEEAGREARRTVFAQERESCLQENPERKVWVALAHQADDQAETILMALARGAGLHGLAGMAWQEGIFVRPLLGLQRFQIEEYLRAKGFAWQEDETNEEDDYTRNRVRHRIVPALVQDVNAGAVMHMAAAAEELRETDEYMAAQAREWLDQNGQQRETGLYLPRRSLLNLPPVLRRRILLLALTAASGRKKDLRRVHIQALEGLLAGGNGTEYDLPYGVKALRLKEGILLK